jgi:hypothetical protein
LNLGHLDFEVVLDFDIRISDFLLLSAFGGNFACLAEALAKEESIKNNKLCKTNPISEEPKTIVTTVMTMTNDNKSRTMNYLKQTQSNPILNGADSVELAEQRVLADKVETYLCNVTLS